MSAHELFTRCPTCKTVYRTHEEQLSVQAGKVRCGQCRMVFDGRAHLTDLSPQRESLPDDVAGGPPTVMVRTSDHLSTPQREAASTAYDDVLDEPYIDHQRLAGSIGAFPGEEESVAETDAEPLVSESTGADLDDSRSLYVDTGDGNPETHHAADEGVREAHGSGNEHGEAIAFADALASRSSNLAADEDARLDPDIAEPDAAAAAEIDVAAEAAEPAEDLVMPSWEEAPAPPRRGVRWAYGIAALLLLGALAAQAAYHFRHYLAAEHPRLRPQLTALCATLGCAINPLRNRDDITIESHDLQADPAHQGLLILQTTLRNQARHSTAFPHLELELNDIAGQPIVRRVFAPVEYAGGAADFSRGIPANSEWNVKIFLDASSVTAGGYNLYLFYP
ncbi:MAG: zinc-ribbon and DUF3426 domain-containing protein [Betaproteobacteria bacterium]